MAHKKHVTYKLKEEFEKINSNSKNSHNYGGVYSYIDEHGKKHEVYLKTISGFGILDSFSMMALERVTTTTISNILGDKAIVPAAPSLVVNKKERKIQHQAELIEGYKELSSLYGEPDPKKRKPSMPKAQVITRKALDEIENLADIFIASMQIGDPDCHRQNIGFVEKDGKKKAARIDFDLAGCFKIFGYAALQVKPNPHSFITNIFKKNHYSEDIITSPKFIEALEKYNNTPPNFNREAIKTAFQETKDAYKDTYIFGKLAFMVVAWFIGVSPKDFLNVDAVTDKYIKNLNKRYEQFKKLEIDIKLQNAIMVGDDKEVAKIVETNKIDANKYVVHLFDLHKMTDYIPPKYKASIEELTKYWQEKHKSDPKRMIVAKENNYPEEILNKIPVSKQNVTRQDLDNSLKTKHTSAILSKRNSSSTSQLTQI